MNRKEKEKKLKQLYSDIPSCALFPEFVDMYNDMRLEAYTLEKELGRKHKITPPWLKKKND